MLILEYLIIAQYGISAQDRVSKQTQNLLFDRSLVEAVQGIAFLREDRLPFAQILEHFIIL